MSQMIFVSTFIKENKKSICISTKIRSSTTVFNIDHNKIIRKFSFVINLILKYLDIYTFYCIYDQLNAVLMIIVLTKNIYLTNPKPLNGSL